MIVVVGQPLYRETVAGAALDGLPARIALASAAHGRSVQLVGKVGEDAAADAVVLALAQGGVGHVALLRDAGRSTSWAADPEDEPPAPGSATVALTVRLNLEPADIDLAVRYLNDFGVLVLGDPATPDVVRVVRAAASWAGARLIVVVPAGEAVPDGLPPDAIVFEAPDADPDGAFATMVGSFAAALDDGGDPAEAFRSTIEADGWTPR